MFKIENAPITRNNSKKYDPDNLPYEVDTSGFVSSGPGGSIKLQPPYSDRYNVGVVFRADSGSVPRIYIRLYSTETKDSTIIGYARYVYQVKHWKEVGEEIPKHLEVDHINDNALDNRLANLQLLTRAQNIRKRDVRQYHQMPVTDFLIDEIRSMLERNYARFEIADKLDKPKGFIRYLINTYIPEFSRPEHIEKNAADIMSRYQAGEKQQNIADDYGVDQATISRLLIAHGVDKRETRRKAIAEAIKDGLSYSEMGRQLGCDCSNIVYYMKSFFIDEFNRRREVAAAELKAVQDRDRKDVRAMRAAMEADPTMGLNQAARAVGAVGEPYVLAKKYDSALIKLSNSAVKRKLSK